VKRRQQRLQADLARFVQKYARKKPRKGEPNDRKYSHDVQRMVRRISPQDFDHLLHDDADHKKS
jgi:hypothetical protein